MVEFYPFLAQVKDPASLPYGFAEQAGARYARPAGRAGRADRAEQELAAAATQGLEEFEERLSHRGLPDRRRPASSAARASRASSRPSPPAPRQVRILNLPNRGAVPNLPDYAVLEVEGVTDSCGARGLYAGEAPALADGPAREAHRLAGAGGRRRPSRATATWPCRRCCTDEMAIRPELAEQMLDELLAASRELLPQFA